MLTLIIVIPLLAALFIALVLRDDRLVRLFALAVTIVEFGLAIVIFTVCIQGGDGYHLVEQHDWIKPLNIQYLLAVDGLSSPFVLLTGMLGMSACFVSFGIRSRVREYFVWLLVLLSAVMGVFVSLDFVLFFIFWELELLPMYMLIYIWGNGRKEYSAMKFLIFTFSGSAFMLIGLLILYFSTGTFDMRDLPEQIELAGKLLIPTSAVFLTFLVAFAVKLPVWPLHTWLPDAHTDAPTAVSVLLAGVLLKMGGYGLIRVCVAMFPESIRDHSGSLAMLAVVSILYGAIITLRQTDLKRLIAYSSVSHMGFVLLGISTIGSSSIGNSVIGVNGAAMQMFTHGTITGLLFIVVGSIYDRTHTRHIPDLGGLASRMPFIAIIFMIAGLASLGLPGLSGFVSELLVLIAVFSTWKIPAVLATTGIVLCAGYTLWMAQHVILGPERSRYAKLEGVKLNEVIPMAILTACIVVVGVYPSFLIDSFESAIIPMVNP
jgi:NADH-quinone oxidoreductase subunit M